MKQPETNGYDGDGYNRQLGGRVLKATAGDLLIFGLSDGNLQRLREGKPILIDLTQMGSTGRVLIFHGKTEADLAKLVQPYITPDTRIHGLEN